jgi:hypothetical protein
MLRDRCTILSIEIGINFVKEMKRGRIAGLDREDER